MIALGISWTHADHSWACLRSCGCSILANECVPETSHCPRCLRRRTHGKKNKSSTLYVFHKQSQAKTDLNVNWNSRRRRRESHYNFHLKMHTTISRRNMILKSHKQNHATLKSYCPYYYWASWKKEEINQIESNTKKA